ncbi:MAG TPA: lipocalin-like domain-containing protein [Vicinamibacteria bacterium]
MRGRAGLAILVGAALGAPTDGTRLRLARPEPPAFARATEPRSFRLPIDHGPHFEFQTEWWYYTGNLVAEDGRRFGFQLTFFRRGLSPGPPAPEGLSTNQVYFAHFAVTDVAAGRHQAAERFSRGAAGLAGASGQPFGVWLEDWSARAPAATETARRGGTGEDRRDGSTLHLTAREGGLALDLELSASKPLVLHGDRGLSAKSDEPGNASYYVGYTRMSARGRIAADGGPGVPVSGEAWFDHEWSTSALGPGAVGWDWFSLQLSDGRELMFFEIRRADGGREAASSGTLVAADGRTRRLGPDDVRVQALGKWRSPETKADYPARWRIQVPSEALELEVEPRVADQELHTSFTYWEGAVGLRGTSRGSPVTGQGYVELTGYAGTMQGVF